MPCLSGRRFTNCNGELGNGSVILSLLWPPKRRLLQRLQCMSCSSLPWRQHPTEQKLRRICGGKIEQSASNLPGSNRDFQAGLDQHWLVHAMLGSSPLAEGRRGSAVGRQLNEEAAPLASKYHPPPDGNWDTPWSPCPAARPPASEPRAHRRGQEGENGLE